MGFRNETKATKSLETINFYRLKGYWHPFRQTDENGSPTNRFIKGLHFEDILRLYGFDRTLRLLALDALEKIEVALRTQISLHVGKLEPHAYLEPRAFSQNVLTPVGWGQASPYVELQKKLQGRISRSREDFITDFKSRFKGQPPIWIAVELWDFGDISKFLSYCQEDIIQGIAGEFGLKNTTVFCSWVRSLNYVRNICAHHGRLWNRGLVDQPRQPSATDLPLLAHLSEKPEYRERLYSVLAIANFMLGYVHPSTSWTENLKQHLLTFPALDQFSLTSSSGFPEQWQDLPLWKTD